MAALLLGVKLALSSIPNFEMVTLLVILFAKVFGREVFRAIAVFNICELIYWGFAPWWVAYLYIWNLLALVTILLRNALKDDSLMWAVVSAVSGLTFGGLCSLVYLPISVTTMVSYFLSGLPWDIWHGICNFVLMLALYKPLNKVLCAISKGRT